MRYKLIKEINPNYTAQEQVLTNRGIDITEIKHYLNTTDKDISAPECFGEDKLKSAAAALIQTISADKNALVVVDCDCDGYTSSAILINYLHDLFPAWVDNHLKYFMHEGKAHGLSDVMDYIFDRDFSLVILPDSSSNDYDYHARLKMAGIQTIILDHHEADKISEDAIVINNQLSDYPNKFLSGAGVVYQFCKYLDKILGKDIADNYLDLVALGLTGDMMSLRSIETKHLITKGFKTENLQNPFVYGMFTKNSFSLGSHITPMGAAFYIVPLVNAIVRSGTLDEMELTFKSMLKHEAFKMILSNKRGHKPGEEERVIDQALRTVTNVKNRQTRAQDAGMDMLETMIKENNMMEHKVLLFLLKPGQLDANIAGLVANKLMAKYQRPVCVLTKVEVENPNIQLTSNPPQPFFDVYYRGSARGYSKSGVESFRDICLETGCVEYAQGHANAFGISIPAQYVEDFIAKTDIALANMETEPLYYVDYIFKGVDVSGDKILDIAFLSDLWGQDIDESLVCIEDLKITKNNLTLMSPDKKPTLKITLPNKLALIKFGSSQEEYDSLLTDGYIKMNVIGKCNANEWAGNVNPQLLIEDWEITGQSKYDF